MKVWIALLVATLKNVSAVYRNCEVAGGDVFTAGFNGLRGDNSFDCSGLDDSCLTSILDQPGITNKTPGSLGNGFIKLFKYCEGNTALKRFPNSISDGVMKKYFTSQCAAFIDPAQRKTCVQEIIYEFQGNNGDNCHTLTSLKAVFDTDGLQSLNALCVIQIKDPYANFVIGEIPTLLKYIPEEVWEYTLSTQNEHLKNLIDGSPNCLLNALLDKGKKLLEMVFSLMQFHVEVIKKISDGAQVLAMSDPFVSLDSNGLKAIHANIWNAIAASPTEVTKAANINLAALKTALQSDASFVTRFGGALTNLPSSLLRQFDKDTVEILKDHLTENVYSKFNGSVVAKATASLVVAAKDGLRAILTDPNPSNEKKIFVEDFCGVFDDFGDLRAKFNTMMLPNVPSMICFLKLQKPLKRVGGVQLASITRLDGSLIDAGDYFPTGFTKGDMTKTIFSSLNEVSLYKYDSSHAHKSLMEIFCGWGFTNYVDENKKIKNIEIGNDCYNKMQDSKAFNKNKSIADNLNAGVLHKDIDASQMIAKTIPQYFSGIKAVDLALLPEDVIKKLSQNADYIAISMQVFSDALKITDSNLFYSRIPESFYKAFSYEILDLIKEKLEKAQWTMTNPENHKTGASWITETKLKEALEDKNYMAFLKNYCSKRKSVTEMKTSFTGFKMTLNCLENLTEPLAGLVNISDIAELDNDNKLKLKKDVFDDMKPRSLTKTMFASIEGSILNSDDQVFIAFCEYANPDWLNADKTINNKAVHVKCQAKMKRSVDRLKEDIDSVPEKKDKRVKFDEAPKEARIELISDDKQCEIFENLSQFGEIVDQVTAACFKKISGTKKLSDLTTLEELKPEIFEFIQVDDVESPALWETVSEAQLGSLKKFDSVPSSEEYKTHPCFKLNAHKFLEQIKSALKKKEIKEICYRRTKIQGNSSKILQPELGLFVLFMSIFALFF